MTFDYSLRKETLTFTHVSKELRRLRNIVFHSVHCSKRYAVDY